MHRFAFITGTSRVSGQQQQQTHDRSALDLKPASPHPTKQLRHLIHPTNLQVPIHEGPLPPIHHNQPGKKVAVQAARKLRLTSKGIRAKLSAYPPGLPIAAGEGIIVMLNQVHSFLGPERELIS